MVTLRAFRRAALTLLVLVSFCAAYAAPLGVALLQSASPRSCCPKGKGAHCSRASHGQGWTAANTHCGGGCPGAFANASAAPALTAAARANTDALAADGISAPVTLAAAKSSSYPAFLYQRPPPAC